MHIILYMAMLKNTCVFSDLLSMFWLLTHLCEFPSKLQKFAFDTCMFSTCTSVLHSLNLWLVCTVEGVCKTESVSDNYVMVQCGSDGKLNHQTLSSKIASLQKQSNAGLLN